METRYTCAIDRTAGHVRNRWFLALFTLISTALPVCVWAVPVTYNTGPLQFATSGQSMWGPGQAVTLDKQLFLGTTWNTPSTNLGIGITGSANSLVPGTGGTIPNPAWALWWTCDQADVLGTGVCGGEPSQTIANPIPAQYIDTRTGYTASVNTSGATGFNLDTKLNSGSINAAVEYNASLVLPEARVGTNNFFNLNPDSSLAGGQLDTNLAEVSASVDAVLGAKANLTGQVCFIGFGCNPDSGSGSTSIGFNNQTLELASFGKENPADPNSETVIKILGVADPAAFQFGQEISIPSPTNPLGSVGGVTLHIPDINASGGVSGNKLTAGGMDDFLDLRVDLDGLIMAPLGLPGGGISTNLGIFDISADLIDIDIGPTIKLVQDFELTPTLMVDLMFDNPVLVAGVGQVTQLTAAWDDLPDIAMLTRATTITPTFWIDGLFTNNTSLGVDGVFTLDVLQASLALSAFGLSVDLGQIGPLYEYVARGNLFNTPSIFSNTYALAGFDPILGESFTIYVPEPDVVLLLGIGLLRIAWAGRKRCGKNDALLPA